MMVIILVAWYLTLVFSILFYNFIFFVLFLVGCQINK